MLFDKRCQNKAFRLRAAHMGHKRTRQLWRNKLRHEQTPANISRMGDIWDVCARSTCIVVNEKSSISACSVFRTIISETLVIRERRRGRRVRLVSKCHRTVTRCKEACKTVERGAQPARAGPQSIAVHRHKAESAWRIGAAYHRAPSPFPECRKRWSGGLMPLAADVREASATG